MVSAADLTILGGTSPTRTLILNPPSQVSPKCIAPAAFYQQYVKNANEVSKGTTNRSSCFRRAFELLDIEHPHRCVAAGTPLAWGGALTSPRERAGSLLSGYYYPVTCAVAPTSSPFPIVDHMVSAHPYAVVWRLTAPWSRENHLLPHAPSPIGSRAVTRCPKTVTTLSQMRAVQEEATMLGEATAELPTLVQGRQHSRSAHRGLGRPGVVDTSKHSARLHGELGARPCRWCPGAATWFITRRPMTSLPRSMERGRHPCGPVEPCRASGSILRELPLGTRPTMGRGSLAPEPPVDRSPLKAGQRGAPAKEIT